MAAWTFILGSLQLRRKALIKRKREATIVCRENLVVTLYKNVKYIGGLV